MIAKEGYVLVGAAILIGIVLWAIGWQFSSFIRWVLAALGILVVAFTLYFFRDPARTPPQEAVDGKLLLAPADGKVVEIVTEEEPLYLKGNARRLSIFLSPLNVHVNRAPATGVIEYDQYVPGEYLVAWHPKASEKNERSQLGMVHASGTKILFKQIAGAVARRIVYHIGVGDSVRAGERFGIVKFGSRMDVIVPPSIDFVVSVGDVVRAGETVLASLPVQEAGAGNVHGAGGEANQ